LSFQAFKPPSLPAISHELLIASKLHSILAQLNFSKKTSVADLSASGGFNRGQLLSSALEIDEEKPAYKTSKKTRSFSIARRQQTYYIS